MVLLDVKESKVPFVMELLDNFSFIKTKPVTKELLLQEIKTEEDALTTVNMVVKEKPLFANTFGIWAGRDIDIKEIRKERRERRTKYYDNATV